MRRQHAVEHQQREVISNARTRKLLFNECTAKGKKARAGGRGGDQQIKRQTDWVHCRGLIWVLITKSNCK